MTSVEQMLVTRLAEIKKEMKGLAVERNKVRAALQAIKGLTSQEVTDKSPNDLTFKDKIKIALKDPRFQRTGATANEILAWCNGKWPETGMVRSSLSPQLSRLKMEGVILLIGKNWILNDQKENGPEEESSGPENSQEDDYNDLI